MFYFFFSIAWFLDYSSFLHFLCISQPPVFFLFIFLLLSNFAMDSFSSVIRSSAPSFNIHTRSQSWRSQRTIHFWRPDLESVFELIIAGPSMRKRRIISIFEGLGRDRVMETKWVLHNFDYYFKVIFFFDWRKWGCSRYCRYWRGLLWVHGTTKMMRCCIIC